MKQEDRKQIEEIIGQMSCPKGFKCAESGFRDLCKAEDVGLERHLLCLDGDAFKCEFSLVLNRQYFCICPLRVYLAKHVEE